jgi:hypothetical protein
MAHPHDPPQSTQWTALIVIIASTAIVCASDLVRIVRGKRPAP